MKQPEALILADYIDQGGDYPPTLSEAATELRRLHALNTGLVNALLEIQQVACSESPELSIATAALSKATEQAC